MGVKHSIKPDDNKFDTTIFSGKTSRKLYKIGSKKLGRGAFGTVFRGKSIVNPDLHVAIKAFKKKDLVSDNMRAIEGEIKNLRSLDHPNIVKYYEAVEDSKNIFIVTEFCQGITLAKYLAEHDEPIPEEEAAYILEQLLSATNHCHSNKIVHRDIKPDNIMIDKFSNVTLLDFGLSKLTGKKGYLKSAAGCPFFVAPEVLKENYSNKWDIWSLGVILYIMLSGNMPFGGENAEEIIKSILEGHISFTEKVWRNVSKEAIDLVIKMMNPNPKNRISAKQALEHEWFEILKSQETTYDFSNINTTVLDSMKNFKWDSLLQKAALYLLVKMVPDDEYKELKLEFRKIDDNSDGMLSFDELKTAFNQIKPKLSDKEIMKIINKLDFIGNQKINYTEFLVSTIDLTVVKKPDLIKDLFKQFDR